MSMMVIFSKFIIRTQSDKCEFICGANRIGYLKFICFLKIQITIAMENM